jgi:phosphoribosylaminoimidazolecarboxamide formyltransferase/IMP cyclohydrolase
MEASPRDNTALVVHRALISVSEKSGIVELARELASLGIEIISTGGTSRILTDAGLSVTPVSNLTGFPEILDGRVKTLHPNIHAGLLAMMDNPRHREELEQHGIRPIDLVVVNLYPFEATVTGPDVQLEEAIENIDIGGPAMVRAAAKNYRHTAVVVSPRRYEEITQELKESGGSIGAETRFDLACEAFAHTAHYDAVISRYLELRKISGALPAILTLTEQRHLSLRYGENPHQEGAFHTSSHPLFEKIHGRELSYNNVLDLDAASSLCGEFDQPAVVIVKHNNPCGVAVGTDLSQAFAKALATDPKSAFGGIVAVNRPVDRDAAGAMNELFLELIAAPDFSDDALMMLRKKKDRRLIRLQWEAKRGPYEIRSAMGGYLVQTIDRHSLSQVDLKVVTARKPMDDELQAMFFAWRVAKHVKSNAIVYSAGDRTLGIGAGQMSRVDSARIAAQKAEEAGLDLKGCAVASDAFFPFADGLLEAVRVGATAVIQPGGSIRDAGVIRAADDHGIAMVFTGIRHFRH